MRRSLRASTARRLNSPTNTFGQPPLGSSRIKIRPSRPVAFATVSTAFSNGPGRTTCWWCTRNGFSIRNEMLGATRRATQWIRIGSDSTSL